MINRTYDLETILTATSSLRPEIAGFYPEEWLENENNVALVDGEGNVSMFEQDFPGVYSGHYFFTKARGAKALKLSREMLDIMFNEYPCFCIRGITPLEMLGARWLSKKLGFESHGVIHTLVGPCELLTLTKEDWMNNE